MPISYVALDDDVARRRRGRRATMRWWRRTLPSGWIGGCVPSIAALGVEQRLEHLVLDDDRGQRPPARLGVVGGDGGDRLADVAHDVGGEHRLVLARSARTSACPGTSSAVMIAVDAGDPPRRATVDATTMRAYGCGERSVAPHSAPSAGRSDEKANAPWTLAIAVGARRASRRCRPARRASPSRSSVTRHRSPRRRGDGDLLHGLDDPAVAGAAADVAGQLLADLDARSGCGVAVEQGVGGHDQPGRAEPALHGAGVDERLLHVGRRARLGEALDGR